MSDTTDGRCPSCGEELWVWNGRVECHEHGPLVTTEEEHRLRDGLELLRNHPTAGSVIRILLDGEA